jgi:hypothetical protein
MSSSSLEKAREALERLEVAMKMPTIRSSKLNDGVIFSLRTGSGKVYVGFEYEGRIEYELKDLLVRYVAYKSMGYLYESSAGVLDDVPVEFGVLEKVEVKSKYELARLAEVYMLELGKDVCVNVYKPEELKRGFAVGLYENDLRIKDIEKYKKMKEKELDSLGVDIVEYRKGRMVEIRGLKDELYEKMIKF